jgi:hypothetical protein
MDVEALRSRDGEGDSATRFAALGIRFLERPHRLLQRARLSK